MTYEGIEHLKLPFKDHFPKPFSLPTEMGGRILIPPFWISFIVWI